MYLVRHGRTDANAQGLLQGRLDPPLDEVGCRQAQAIAAMVGPVDEVTETDGLKVFVAQELAAPLEDTAIDVALQDGASKLVFRPKDAPQPPA